MPRLPSTMPTRISGTISARNGVWRPTIAPRSSFGRSVRPASVTIGIAIAPNATGAVLATSATDAAFIGLKPRPTSIDAVIATGVPKPASASSSAPKENAMITAWMRWSSRDALERAPQHGEVPGALGHVVDPDRVEDDPHDREQAEGGALEAGVERLPDRHRVDDDRDEDRDEQRDSAAQWAFSFRPPSSTNRVMSGSAAKMVLANSELPTGSKCCV